MSFSANFDDHSRGVTWLVSRCLVATRVLILLDPAGRLCVLDVTIKDKAFRLIGVYRTNATRELPTFFRRIKPYVIPSKQVILAGDWNAILDPNLDREAINAGTNTLDAKHFASLSNDLISLINFAKHIQIRYLGLGPVGVPRPSFAAIWTEFQLDELTEII